jgi:hypothetical protein
MECTFVKKKQKKTNRHEKTSVFRAMTFSISALVLTRDSHIKPDSEAGGLIWVEG